MNSPSTGRKARILIILDDPVLLGLVTGTLRPDGYDILVVDSVRQALAITPREYQRIDLAIVRIHNKPITGLEFAKRLAQRGIDVPMVFMSASHSMAAVLANNLGQSAVLEEPFTAAALRTAVRKCLAGRRHGTDRAVVHGEATRSGEFTQPMRFSAQDDVACRTRQHALPPR